MVDGLDVGREPRTVAIDVEWPQTRRDRPRRRHGSGARRTFGEELGVPLVQPGNGFTEPVGGEIFAAPASSLRVDLHDSDLLDIECADIELSAGCRAR
jgi:hypothetical protein